MIIIHPPKKVTHIRISDAPGSRRSAAIFGISLILLLGIVLLVQNTHTLMGQLTESSLTIRITQLGLDPASITVPPGATVTWNNADTKPHILSSDTLLTTDGLLYSTAIFPEEEFSATVTEDSPPGEHSYVSLTDAAISGTLHIEEMNTNPLLPPPPPLIPPPLPPVPPPLSPPPLPHNPLVAEMLSQPSSLSPSTPLQKPFRNPETGFPLGISLLVTVTSTLFLTRRILRSPHAQSIRP